MRLMHYRGVIYSAATKSCAERHQLLYSRTTFDQRIEQARKSFQLVYRGVPYQLLLA